MLEFAGLIIGVLGGLITAYSIYNGRNTKKIINSVDNAIEREGKASRELLEKMDSRLEKMDSRLEKMDERSERIENRAEQRHKEVIDLIKEVIQLQKKGFGDLSRDVKNLKA